LRLPFVHGLKGRVDDIKMMGYAAGSRKVYSLYAQAEKDFRLMALCIRSGVPGSESVFVKCAKFVKENKKNWRDEATVKRMDEVLSKAITGRFFAEDADWVQFVFLERLKGYCRQDSEAIYRKLGI